MQLKGTTTSCSIMSLYIETSRSYWFAVMLQRCLNLLYRVPDGLVNFSVCFTYAGAYLYYYPPGAAVDRSGGGVIIPLSGSAAQYVESIFPLLKYGYIFYKAYIGVYHLVIKSTLMSVHHHHIGSLDVAV